MYPNYSGTQETASSNEMQFQQQQQQQFSNFEFDNSNNISMNNNDCSNILNTVVPQPAPLPIQGFSNITQIDNQNEGEPQQPPVVTIFHGIDSIPTIQQVSPIKTNNGTILNSTTGTNGTTTPRRRSRDDSQSKRRYLWTSEVHAVFLEALGTLGADATPSKILKVMQSSSCCTVGITREQVASHLQKHRQSLKSLLGKNGEADKDKLDPQDEEYKIFVPEPEPEDPFDFLKNIELGECKGNVAGTKNVSGTKNTKNNSSNNNNNNNNNNKNKSTSNDEEPAPKRRKSVSGPSSVASTNQGRSTPTRFQRKGSLPISLTDIQLECLRKITNHTSAPNQIIDPATCPSPIPTNNPSSIISSPNNTYCSPSSYIPPLSPTSIQNSIKVCSTMSQISLPAPRPVTPPAFQSNQFSSTNSTITSISPSCSSPCMSSSTSSCSSTTPTSSPVQFTPQPFINQNNYVVHSHSHHASPIPQTPPPPLPSHSHHHQYHHHQCTSPACMQSSPIPNQFTPINLPPQNFSHQQSQSPVPIITPTPATTTNQIIHPIPVHPSSINNNNNNSPPSTYQTYPVQYQQPPQVQQPHQHYSTPQTVHHQPGCCNHLYQQQQPQQPQQVPMMHQQYCCGPQQSQPQQSQPQLQTQTQPQTINPNVISQNCSELQNSQDASLESVWLELCPPSPSPKLTTMNNQQLNNSNVSISTPTSNSSMINSPISDSSRKEDIDEIIKDFSTPTPNSTIPTTPSIHESNQYLQSDVSEQTTTTTTTTVQGNTVVHHHHHHHHHHHPQNQNQQQQQQQQQQLQQTTSYPTNYSNVPTSPSVVSIPSGLPCACPNCQVPNSQSQPQLLQQQQQMIPQITTPPPLPPTSPSLTPSPQQQQFHHHHHHTMQQQTTELPSLPLLGISSTSTNSSSSSILSPSQQTSLPILNDSIGSSTSVNTSTSSFNDDPQTSFQETLVQIENHTQNLRVSCCGASGNQAISSCCTSSSSVESQTTTTPPPPANTTISSSMDQLLPHSLTGFLTNSTEAIQQDIMYSGHYLHGGHSGNLCCPECFSVVREQFHECTPLIY